ncbi:Uma2 family endonuclease [Rhodoflexus caldus]|uniref:Uma2 family endonuclease n=1 Tax=Rhodoflexus caldus TaxID=2891236 RepID=UPI00202AB485|nr:Uma2 family endonuclease [Rhodoflexus caldus]
MTEAITLSFKSIGGLSQEEFMQFCLENPDLKFERTSEGQIIITPNTGGRTGDLNSEINMQLRLWNKATNLGKVFDSSTSFRLASGAVRSPDAAWIAKERWEQLSEQEKEEHPPLCSDFIVELRGETETIGELTERIQEFITNGCRLAWLIDADAQTVYVYRPDAVPETVQGFNQRLSGGDVLPGFELDLSQLQ